MAKNVIFNMAAAAILHCYLVTLDHPRSLLRYGHLKILQIWLKTLIPAPIFAFLGVLTPKHYFSSSRPSKGTSLGESASFKVYIVKIRPHVFAVGDDKKKREGKEREGKVHKVTLTSRLYFTNMGWSRPPWTDIHKNWQGCRVHDVINHSKFGFNIFRGFRSTGGQNFRFPIDFAGHRYNSADATAQPVIVNNIVLV